MTLVSDIIRQAYRENNILAITQPLTTEQEDEGLTLLNSIFLSSIGNEIGEKLNNWPIGNMVLFGRLSGTLFSGNIRRSMYD